jgi:hypothetical protein
MAARNTPSKGGKPDKLMRAALALELHRNVDGENYGFEGKVKRLRLVANSLVNKAIDGDTAAIREINDRMDGKVPQAVVGGDDESNPIRFADITDEQRAKALSALLAKVKSSA